MKTKLLTGCGFKDFTVEEHHFPLLIEYTDTEEQFLVYKPDRIESGRAFVVIETRASAYD